MRNEILIVTMMIFAILVGGSAQTAPDVEVSDLRFIWDIKEYITY